MAREGHRIDVAGAVTATGGLVAIVYGLLQAASHPWGSWRVLLPLLGGVGLLLVMAAVEARSPEPLIPVRFFANRTRVTSNVLEPGPVRGVHRLRVPADPVHAAGTRVFAAADGAAVPAARGRDRRRDRPVHRADAAPGRQGDAGHRLARQRRGTARGELHPCQLVLRGRDTARADRVRRVQRDPLPGPDQRRAAPDHGPGLRPGLRGAERDAADRRGARPGHPGHARAALSPAAGSATGCSRRSRKPRATRWRSASAPACSPWPACWSWCCWNT